MPGFMDQTYHACQQTPGSTVSDCQDQPGESLANVQSINVLLPEGSVVSAAAANQQKLQQGYKPCSFAHDVGSHTESLQSETEAHL